MDNNPLTADKKRQNFRLQIRRKQIETIFTNKRKLHLKHCQRQPQNKFQKVSLHQLLARLKMRTHNMTQTLVLMSEVLAEDDCLEEVEKQQSQSTLIKLCRDIVSTLLNIALPTFNRKSKQHAQARIRILNCLANMLADPFCPIPLLLEPILQALDSHYNSVSEWGRDKQTMQIGWIMVNGLIHKSIICAGNTELERSVEMMLIWIEEIILFNDPDLLGYLFKSLHKFFNHIDEVYSVEGESEVEHYKVHRLILLSLTIEVVLDDKQITQNNHKILLFIHQNILYLNSCEEYLPAILTKKLFSLLSYPAQKVRNESITIILKLVHIYHEPYIQNIQNSHFQTILLNLQLQPIRAKLSLLHLLKQICIVDRGKEIELMVEYKLEEVLMKLAVVVSDVQILEELCSLCSILLNNSGQKYGLHLALTLDKHHGHKAGEIGKIIDGLLDYWKLH